MKGGSYNGEKMDKKDDGFAFLYQGVDRISTFCVEYIKRVYQTGR
jgi:hypothetical protein